LTASDKRKSVGQLEVSIFRFPPTNSNEQCLLIFIKASDFPNRLWLRDFGEASQTGLPLISTIEAGLTTPFARLMKIKFQLRLIDKLINKGRQAMIDGVFSFSSLNFRRSTYFVLN